MLDWVDWKHSGIISSSNFIFEPSEFLFGPLNLFPPSCPPGPDDPALILWYCAPWRGPLLIQMPALSVPCPPWDGKQLLDIFQPRNPFCQLEHNCMQEKKKGLPITQPDLASDSNGEGEKLGSMNCLFNPIQIQIQQGQSKLCGVNRVLLTAAFAARL